MYNMYFSVGDIEKLFRAGEKIKSRSTLLNSEERGEIPKAERVPRGKTLVRMWNVGQLPFIGEKFGFLKKPSSQKIICIYTPKGGVLKTSFSYNLARMLALNGIKTIIIGLDIQCSITNYALHAPQVESIIDLPTQKPGLYSFFYEKMPLSDIIQPTSLPTLYVVPEVPELNFLEKKLRLEPRREYIFSDKLLNELTDYEVIIFDNSPSWNQLVENALTVSNIIVSPMGCDIETFQALKTNLSLIFDFKSAMGLRWDHFIQVPTLLEKTNVSQQIYATYLSKYGDAVIPCPIRRSVIGQEARVFKQCVIEHEPLSSLAQDYCDAVKNLWGKIN